MIFAVYKPSGPTSNDIVQMIKKLTGQKVGHAGTLDPLACGVLVIGVGRESTKKLNIALNSEKEYIAKIKLGEISTTDDREGEKAALKEASLAPKGREKIADKKPSLTEIKNILPKFTGKIEQVPPIYSAVKIKGKEAYKLARKGKKVEINPRIVEIKEIKILTYKYPFLTLKIITGKGAYIRSLARDLGKNIKTGAYLYELERTRVGEFSKNKAISSKNLEKYLKNNGF